MKTAITYLTYQHNTPKIGIMGFGFGASLALSLSSGQALALYYPTQLTIQNFNPQIPILAVFGDRDAFIPVSKVEQFKDALSQLGLSHEVYIYPGVAHAFNNPASRNYAPQESKDAWDKTLDFLTKHLK